MVRPVTPAISRAKNSEIIIASDISGVGLAMGAIPFATGISKFGLNETIGTTDQTIWDAGGLYPWPEVSDTLTIVSDNVNDTAAGTGARSIIVEGLDENFLMQEELIILNGLTPIVTTKTWSRVHRSFVTTGGSLGEAQGVILLSHTTSGDLLANIQGHNNQTLQSLYTIPADKNGYVKLGKLSAGRGKEVRLSFYFRPPGGVFVLGAVAIVYENNYDYEFFSGSLLPSKTDIDIRARCDTGTVVVAAAFDLILIDV